MPCKQPVAIQRPSDRMVLSGTRDRSVPLEGGSLLERISSYRLVVAAGKVKTSPSPCCFNIMSQI